MCAEGQTTTERRHQKFRPRFNETLFERFAKRDRYGRRGHVAVPLDVHEHALHRHSGALGDEFDDPQIRLVRNHEVDVVGSDAGASQHVFTSRAHAVDRFFEYFLTFELPLGRPE